MNDFFKYAADMLREAAKTPLGILALLILVLAFLAFKFFSDAPLPIRLAIFLCMLALTCFVGGVALLQKTQTFAIEKAQTASREASLHTLLLAEAKPQATDLRPVPPGEEFKTHSTSETTPSYTHDADSAKARADIASVFEDAGAKRIYDMGVRKGLSKYQAVVAAQGDNPVAQKTVVTAGKAQTEKFVESLGH